MLTIRAVEYRFFSTFKPNMPQEIAAVAINFETLRAPESFVGKITSSWFCGTGSHCLSSSST
jgi:hypothetical protein